MRWLNEEWRSQRKQQRDREAAAKQGQRRTSSEEAAAGGKPPPTTVTDSHRLSSRQSNAESGPSATECRGAPSRCAANNATPLVADTSDVEEEAGESAKAPPVAATKGGNSSHGQNADPLTELEVSSGRPSSSTTAYSEYKTCQRRPERADKPCRDACGCTSCRVVRTRTLADPMQRSSHDRNVLARACRYPEGDFRRMSSGYCATLFRRSQGSRGEGRPSSAQLLTMSREVEAAMSEAAEFFPHVSAEWRQYAPRSASLSPPAIANHGCASEYAHC